VTLSKRIGFPAPTRKTQSDGTFEFETVAEGEWRIAVKVDQAGSPLWAAQWVQVKGHDLENVELRPAAPFAIQGRVVMEVPDGAPAPQPHQVILAFHAGGGLLGDKPAGAILTGNPDAGGVFHVPNVYAGAYLILPEPAPPRYYLDSIRIGSYDALGSAVEIVSGAQPVTITYKTGGGTVRGKVEQCAGGTVRLIPHDKAMRRPGFVRFAACDANDRYEITAIRPGEYYAIAVAGNSPAPWYATMRDDDGLLNDAGTVTVRAEESTSADLRAIRQ
jgi:hypothetical protein